MSDCGVPWGFKHTRCRLVQQMGWENDCPASDGQEHWECMCQKAAFERTPNDFGVSTTSQNDCPFAYRLQLMGVDARVSEGAGDLSGELQRFRNMLQEYRR